MKERLINLLNMIRKQLKSEPKMSRFKFVVNGFICEDTGQDIKLWFLLQFFDVGDTFLDVDDKSVDRHQRSLFVINNLSVQHFSEI